MTIEDIRELIKTDETRALELKKTTGEIKDGMHSVCAMLNSFGGYVIFGIVPKTLKINGQCVTDNTRQEIAREIKKIEPYVNIPVEYVAVPERDGNQVVVVHRIKTSSATRHTPTTADHITKWKAQRCRCRSKCMRTCCASATPTLSDGTRCRRAT